MNSETRDPHQRRLADSPFPGDDGSASAELREALRQVAEGDEPTTYLSAVAQLCAERILVPVVATATRVGEAPPGGGRAGLVSDKEAEMAVVMLQAQDGRRAMVAFTGEDSMTAWNAEARPVPATIDRAAQAALDDGAVAVLIDLDGPYPLVLEGEVLDHLSAGHRLVALPEGQFGWAVANSDVDAATEAPD
ncbi:MAG: SseB family protein [Propionibacteriaceae bacterium]